MGNAVANHPVQWTLLHVPRPDGDETVARPARAELPLCDRISSSSKALAWPESCMSPYADGNDFQNPLI